MPDPRSGQRPKFPLPFPFRVLGSEFRIPSPTLPTFRTFLINIRHPISVPHLPRLRRVFWQVEAAAIPRHSIFIGPAVNTIDLYQRLSRDPPDWSFPLPVTAAQTAFHHEDPVLNRHGSSRSIYYRAGLAVGKPARWSSPHPVSARHRGVYHIRERAAIGHFGQCGQSTPAPRAPRLEKGN